jgi:hypothetical protein
MQTIDESRLESDLAYRFAYLCQFIGLDSDDLQAIHAAATSLAPLVPSLVDAVYQKLYSYSATWRHFLPRQQGYQGPTADTLEALSPDHPVIAFRKQHLARYLVALVTRPYDGKMVEYLDMVGKIHTPKAGNPEVNVPLVQMNALMGFVSDALMATILNLNLDRETERKTLRAFHKLLWVQHDLIVRHYV